jgi:chaperonin cofactor prefoldin
MGVYSDLTIDISNLEDVIYVIKKFIETLEYDLSTMYDELSRIDKQVQNLTKRIYALEVLEK